MKKCLIVLIVACFMGSLCGCKTKGERKIEKLNREIEEYRKDISDLERELGVVREKIKSYYR